VLQEVLPRDLHGKVQPELEPREELLGGRAGVGAVTRLLRKERAVAAGGKEEVGQYVEDEVEGANEGDTVGEEAQGVGGRAEEEAVAEPGGVDECVVEEGGDGREGGSRLSREVETG
jgi:hypothetical protein